jgi:hypothetical protein
VFDLPTRSHPVETSAICVVTEARRQSRIRTLATDFILALRLLEVELRRKFYGTGLITSRQ